MLDLEMTGLDPVKDEIIEVACFVVEGATLERVPGTELCLAVMPEDPKILDKMDDWNTRTHNESGLIRRVREEGVSIGEAEEEVMSLLKIKWRRELSSRATRSTGTGFSSGARCRRWTGSALSE